jgi:hypothetical protein
MDPGMTMAMDQPATMTATLSAPAPAPATARTTAPAAAPTTDPCGAPRNPFGYEFCGGSLIYSPDPATCEYFHCIANWSNGKGYMEECQDGTYSMSGGRSGSCSHHGGDLLPVYK